LITLMIDVRPARQPDRHRKTIRPGSSTPDRSQKAPPTLASRACLPNASNEARAVTQALSHARSRGIGRCRRHSLFTMSDDRRIAARKPRRLAL